MTGSDAPLVSCVVVNWNTGDLLQRCLESLASFGAARQEIMVVDNGSTDGSVEMIKSSWPEVQLICNTANLGYARANNQALDQATGTYVLLINADAELRPKALGRLVDLMESRPRAGAVGPRLVYLDGTWQRWTAGAAPTLKSAASHFLFLDRLLGDFAPRSIWLTTDVRKPFQPDWVSSACMLLRREALISVGGRLDETYFVYMDDVELCRALKSEGWEIWYEPGSEVVHVMGAASSGDYGGPSPAALRNFNHYFTTRNGAIAGSLLRAIEVLGFGTRAFLYSIASVRQPELRRKARAHTRNARVSLERGHV